MRASCVLIKLSLNFTAGNYTTSLPNWTRASATANQRPATQLLAVLKRNSQRAQAVVQLANQTKLKLVYRRPGAR